MREEQGSGPYHSSQTFGTQESVHQVPDSQKSPGKKRTFDFLRLSIAPITYQADSNPYGTPTSLALIGSQEIDLSAIPDSPLGREAISVNKALNGSMRRDRGSTKSESPELRASVHEVPPTDPVDASGKEPATSATSPKPSETPFIFNSASQPITIAHIVDEYAKKHDLGVRQTSENAADFNRNPNRSSPIASQAPAQRVRSNSKTSRNSDPVFDPIESDTESFNEKQQMQNAKRLRSSKKSTTSFPSPRASDKAGADRRDGHFLVPSVPQSSTNGACIPSGETIREENVEENTVAQEAMERESAARKEAAERKANEERQADNKEAEENARIEEPVQAKKAKAKAEELAEAKRIEETRVNAARLADEKKTHERLARERQTRETGLAKEATKVMLAADGVKSIDAEKKEKEKARLREVVAQKQANEAKAAEQARQAQGKDHEKKAREERFADIQSDSTKNQIHQTGTAQETATALKEHGQKSLADQGVQKPRIHAMPSNPSSANSSTRSMTPFVPGSSVGNPSHQSPLGSSPSSNQSSGSMNAPLRSALRQTPSALRRSISSVSFDVPPRAKLNEHIPSTPKPKSLKELNNELTTKQSSVPNIPKIPPRTVPNAPSKTPIKILVPSNSKTTKAPAKNGKVQTKLNVTRQPKKLKSRAIDLPITSPKQEIIISSGENSSTSEEPVWQTGNAKAGPSSRKPTFPVTTSQGKKTAEVKPGTHVDPLIRNIKIEKDRTAAPAALPRATPMSDTTSLQKSTSRSPAQALSESISLSSGSASGSASGSTSTSDSESKSDSDSGEDIHGPSLKTPTGAADGRFAPGTVKGISGAANVGAKQSQGYLQSKEPSQSRRAATSGSRNTGSMHSDGKHVNQAADKMLQLESRQSISGSRVKQAPSKSNGVPDDSVTRRAPNPGFFQYPTLTDLMRERRQVTPPQLENSSSQPHGNSLLDNSESDDSSSSSRDDSSSNSDEDQDVDGVTSQTSSKQKSNRYPGLKELIKRRLSRP